MRLKAIAIVALLVISCAFSTACQFTTTSEQPPIYKSANVAVSIADDTDTIKYTHYEWAVLTDDIAYTKNTVIVSGVASNIRQASVTYEYMDTTVSDNITIFDIQISDVFSCRSCSFQAGDIVTVGVGYNMNTYGEGLPIIKNGASYLMFCYVAADQKNDVLELSEYLDCWVSSPNNLLLERVGDFYLSIDFFSDVPGSHRLVDFLNLTESQVDSLSAIAVDNTDRVRTFIDDNIVNETKETNRTEAADALFLLKTRTMRNSADLWSLANRSYLISCGDLENYIRATALAYGS